MRGADAGFHGLACSCTVQSRRICWTGGSVFHRVSGGDDPQYVAQASCSCAGGYLAMTASSLRSSTAICVILSFIGSAHAIPLDGKLDPSFGGGGTVTVDLGLNNDFAFAVLVQADGRIVAAGSTHDPVNHSDFRSGLVRLQSNGSLDPSFGSGGIVVGPSGTTTARGVVVDPSGELAVTGWSVASGFDFMLLRYTAAGAIDSSTFTDFGGEEFGNALVRDMSGNFVVAGAAGVSASARHFALARYSSAGALDTSFGSGGIVRTTFGGDSDEAMGLALQPADGKLVAAGYATIGGRDRIALARYNSDGTLDGSFGSGGLVTTQLSGGAQATGVVVQPDGKIVVAGYDKTFKLVRYDSTGALDGGFGSNGIAAAPFPGAGFAQASALLLLPTGRLIAGGVAGKSPTSESGDNFAVARFRSDGTLDGSFGDDGLVTTHLVAGAGQGSVIYGLALHPDGSLVAAGATTVAPPFSAEFAIARYSMGACGNGAIEPGEECDDGNTTAGDGCSAICQCDSGGTPNCDDGDLCTTGDTCTGGSCVGTPTPFNSCHVPLRAGASALVISRGSTAAADKLGWKWSSGMLGAIGDPINTDDYALCIFDGTGQVALSALAPSGGQCGGKPCWAALASGVKYKDKVATPSGLTSLTVKSASGGLGKLAMKGKGVTLDLPLLPLGLPARVQLHAGNGECWESTFSSTGASQSDSIHFKGSSD